MRLRNIFENTTQTIAIIFGRFNPPHKGHKAAWELMSKHDNWYVGTNKSTIGPKDPLPFDVKVEAMTAIWPEVADHIVAETSWLTMASKVWNEYGDVRLLCFTDEDWVVKTLNQYNGKEGAHGLYKFSEIAQQPTPRLSSATALRAAVEADDRDAFSDAAGVSAETSINGTPFFDLVAEYLLPYAEKAKKKKKKVAEGYYTTKTVSIKEGVTTMLIKWFEKRGAKFTPEQKASIELHHAKYNQNETRIQKLTAESNAGENINFKELDRLQKEQEILKQEITRIGKDGVEQGGGYKPLKEATNPWTGKDPAKEKAWAALSPEDQKWLGNADPTDEYILMRAPNKGNPVPAPVDPAAGSEDNMDNAANTGVDQGSEDNMDDASNTGEIPAQKFSTPSARAATKQQAQQAPAPADSEGDDDEDAGDASYMANTDAEQATNQAQIAAGQKEPQQPAAKPSTSRLDAIKNKHFKNIDPATGKLKGGAPLQDPAQSKPAAAPADQTASEPSAPQTTAYKIKRGDTLNKIANANGVTVADIMKANPQIKDPNSIQADATLNIPSKAPASANAAPAKSTIGKTIQGADQKGAQPNQDGTVNSTATQGDATTAQPNADGTVNSTGNAEPTTTTTSTTGTSTDGNTTTDTSNTKTTTQQGGGVTTTTTKTDVPDYTPDQQKADALAADVAEIDQEIADAQAAGDAAKVAELEKEKASLTSGEPAGTGTAANQNAGQPTGVAGAQDANVPDQVGQAQDANVPDQSAGAEQVTAQDISPEEQDAAAKRIEELLKKANLQENIYYNKLAILLNEHSILKEALTPEEMKELQDLLGKVQGNEKYKDLVTRANKAVQAQPTGNEVGDYQNPNKKYTLNGKNATKQEVEKEFGKNAKDDYKDIQQIKQDIQNLESKAKEEKDAWVQNALSGDKYPNGVADDPEDPEYPKELKAIDDKYAAQAEKLQKQSEKLAKDPAVQKLISQGGKDDFDRWFDGDIDSDEYMKLKTGGQSSIKPAKSNTKTSSSSTSNVQSSTQQTKTVSTGDTTTRKATKKGPGPETAKLKKQKQDMELKMKQFRADWRKQNPDAKKLAVVRTPEYKALKDEYKKITAAYRDSFVVVEPGSTTVTPGTTTTSTSNNPNDDYFKDLEENKKLNRIKLLAGLIK